MNYLNRTHPLNRAASDAARSGEPTRGGSVLAWLLLSPILLPIIIGGELIYPYLVPKTLLFYALSLITAGVFVVLVAYGRAFHWHRLARWEAWVPGALLALAYVTSFFGTDFYRSFWSLFVRGDGLLMLTCAVVSFYLIVLEADRAFLARLLYGVSVVGSLVAIYGIGEWLVDGGRIGGLLGNAAFFAGYLGLTVFVTLWAAQTLPRVWKHAAYAGAVLQVVAIILSATRGTILALAVATAVALGYGAYAGKGKWRSGSAGALIALALSGGLFFAFRGQLAHVPFAPIARIASISVADPDVASRLFIWKNMVGEIAKSPWLGVGAEHVDVLFNRFYEPTQIGEQWFDRSHNAFLDYAAQYGIGGLLLYLALIVAFLTTARRYARDGQRDCAFLLMLLAVTYAVQNFFVFDTVSSFWLVLVLLAGSFALSFEGKTEPLLLPAWSRPVAWTGLFLFLILIEPVAIRPAEAAYDLAQAYRYQLVDVAKETSSLSHGYALGTYGDVEYGYEAYDMYANTQAGALSGEARTRAYQAALSILRTNFNRYPYDARTTLYLAHVLVLAPQGVVIDQGLLSSSLERAIRLSPKRAQPWFILTNLSLSQANQYSPGSKERSAGYAAAHDLLARYIGLVPNLSEPYYVLAQLEYASGDVKSAAQSAAEGKKHYQGDIETARRAAIYYENALNLPDAAFFLAEVLRYDPHDAAAAADLAKIKAYESRQ